METQNVEAKVAKKNRKRKRQQINEIRLQMEFYFSDSNLSKDRLLSQLIAKDPNVPLEVFMNFNKIKKNVDSVEDIAKALSKSEFLKLSEDRTTVCRLTPIVECTNVDERTIYVESLPISTTHEWLKTCFEQYGPVAYVSLPKYRASQRIKEFGFVEFEEISGVINAINGFKKFGGLLNMESDPETLTSIVSYLKEKEAEAEALAEPGTTANLVEAEKADLNEDNGSEEVASNVDEEVASNVDEEVASNVDEEVASNADEEVASNVDEEVASNVDEEVASNVDEEVASNVDEEVASNVDEEVASNVDEEVASNVDEQSEAPSDNLDLDSNSNAPVAKRMKLTDNVDAKDRKRLKSDAKEHNKSESNKSKNRNRNISARKKRTTSNTSMTAMRSIRICTKIEWKRLRNKYLNEQREQRKMFKQMFKSNKQPPPTQPLKKIVQNPRKINFYNANKEDGKEVINNKIESIKTPLFTFTPGVIVKVFFDEPCADIADFKRDLRTQSYVKYVDIEEPQTAAFVRVDEPRSAPTLIKHCAPNTCQILTGDNESDYWRKMEVDWKNKISKNIKVAKKRGRDKLAKVIATHTRFEE